MASVFDNTAAVYLSTAGDLQKAILSKVATQSAISGWALSKTLDKSPDDVNTALSELRRKELLETDGDGLEGIYHLTELGYLSRGMF